MEDLIQLDYKKFSIILPKTYIKNNPGPLSPSSIIRPKRNTTARSNSCATFMHTKSENGKRITKNIYDIIIKILLHAP